MIRKIVGWFLVILLTIVVILFVRSGAYKSVNVERVPAPQLQLFYTENIGPYHKIIDKLTVVEDTIKEMGHSCVKTFGHFLSDPKVVEHEKLVSHVGCAFTPEESVHFFTLPKGISEKHFGGNLKDKVCYKGTFDGSPNLSAMKIYPKLIEAAKKDGLKLGIKSLEIYTINDGKVFTEVYLCEDY